MFEITFFIYLADLSLKKCVNRTIEVESFCTFVYGKINRNASSVYESMKYRQRWRNLFQIHGSNRRLDEF